MGCTPRHVVPPPSPAPLPAPADLGRVHLYLQSFTIDGRSEKDTEGNIELFQDRFLDHLESAIAFEQVAYDLKGRERLASPALGLAVSLQLSHTTERTWVFDAVSAVGFFGGSPLVPVWGVVEVAVEARLAVPGSPPCATYREVVRAPYSTMIYGWFRRRPVEAAYSRASAAAFAKVAAEMAKDAERLAATLSSPPAAGAPPLPAELQPVAAAADAALEPGWGGAEVTTLAPLGFSVVSERASPRFDGSLYSLFAILGGVEFSGFAGVANVSSSTRLASGEERQVASGEATETGYRVSLYSAPKITGFFAYPTIGYLRQKIDNVDTRSMLSSLNDYDADQGDIPAVVTDPGTGLSADAGSANSYHLDMQSGYGGFRVGYDLVGGTAAFELFASLNVGVNLVEYRQIRSVLASCAADQPRASCETEHNGWDFLKSGAVGTTIGMRFPKLHGALRFIYDYEIYREFTYARPLQVRGPPVYDPVTGLYQNEMVSMRGAKLQCSSFQLAFAGVF